MNGWSEIDDVQEGTLSRFREDSLDPHPFTNGPGLDLAQQMDEACIRSVEVDDRIGEGGFHGLDGGVSLHDRERAYLPLGRDLDPSVRVDEAERTALSGWDKDFFTPGTPLSPDLHAVSQFAQEETGRLSGLPGIGNLDTAIQDDRLNVTPEIFHGLTF
jgi:hypothetical protein